MANHRTGSVAAGMISTVFAHFFSTFFFLPSSSSGGSKSKMLPNSRWRRCSCRCILLCLFLSSFPQLSWLLLQPTPGPAASVPNAIRTICWYYTAANRFNKGSDSGKGAAILFLFLLPRYSLLHVAQRYYKHKLCKTAVILHL